MEGAGIFTLAGRGNDNSLQRAVHTRRIVDPVFGAKVTGNAGRLDLRHADRARPGPRPEPAGGRSGCRQGSAVQRRASQLQSRAEQLRRRPGTRQRVRRRVQSRRRRRPVVARERHAADQRFRLTSRTRAPHEADTKSGVGAQAGYEFSTRRLVLVGYGEHYDRGFEMQTAFINRVGITSGWGYAEYSFYPDKAKYPWLRRISAFSFTQGGRDRNAGRERADPGLRRTAQLHAPGLLPHRSLRRLRDLGRPAVRPRQLARAWATSSSIAGCP